MKNCRSCRKDIDDSAEICHQCRSYQNRKKQLSIEYISLIVALAVWLPAIGFYCWQAYNYIAHGRSDDVAITFVHVDADKQSVVLFVTNKGGRNAMLRSADVIFPADIAASNATPGWSLDLPSNRLLPAEDERQLDLLSTEGRLRSIADQHQRSITCRIRLVIVRSDDSLKEIYVNYEARQD